MPSGTSGILSWVLIIAVFYFFLIMPERKKHKNMKTMINNVKAGDKIITRGGIYGTIVSLTDDAMVISTGPDNVKMELSKLSISSVAESDQNTDVNEIVENSPDIAESAEAKKNSEDKAE